MKGKVLDDDETIPTKLKAKSRPAHGKASIKQTNLQSQLKASAQQASTKNPFRFPSIQNEEVFESKLQEASSVVNAKRYKVPKGTEDSPFTYSTIRFSGDNDDNDDSYNVKTRPKAPKRSTSISPTQFFNLEQTFGEKQIKFDTEIDNEDDDGFKSHSKFKSVSKAQKLPGKLFKSPEDEFKDSEFFDFSFRPPRLNQQLGSTGHIRNLDKIKSDLGVKSLSLKSQKDNFDPQLQGGFKPSFKLRDFPNIHSTVAGKGIASQAQINQYYEDEDSEREKNLKHKPRSAAKANFQQFLRAKEDERLEKLVEEQFQLQQQKQIAQEKEAELKHQQQALQRQKEKLKQVEKQLSNKVTRQSTRQKRRPTTQRSSNTPRRQRNPNPINFAVASNGQSSHAPLRKTKTNGDGTYRVSFNLQ